MLIQRQFRAHALRERTLDRLGELRGLITLSRHKAGGPVRVGRLEELPFKNCEVQTDAVPELALFKWMRGPDSLKQRAQRTGAYALALALLSCQRVMREERDGK